VRTKSNSKETMKPKPNKNLNLPLTTQQEKASGKHQILLPRKKADHNLTFWPFFPGVLYQFFDLADHAVVNDT